MWVFFLSLSVLLLLDCFWQRAERKKLEKEIRYMGDRLGTISFMDENGFVLIPTGHKSVQDLSGVLNRTLQEFYQKKLEFQQAKETMAQVLTNISHDIRTPLTVLKGNSEMLSRETENPDLPENIHTMAVKIDQKADGVIRTINDYFTMAKIASGDLPLQMKKEDIARLCGEIILDYYDFLEKEGFSVQLEIPDNPVFVSVDGEALGRILKNLLDNAIRHGGKGRFIALRLKQLRDKTVIEVEDHGQGISPQMQQRIFQRNYTTAAQSSGSGLGLTISKQLAQRMGGELQVYSKQNEKTVFSIVLKS